MAVAHSWVAERARAWGRRMRVSHAPTGASEEAPIRLAVIGVILRRLYRTWATADDSGVAGTRTGWEAPAGLCEPRQTV